MWEERCPHHFAERVAEILHGLLEEERNAPPLGALATLAADNQNVHNAVVSVQTNGALDTLLALPVPATQDSLGFLRAGDVKWIAATLACKQTQARAIAKDVKKWYGLAECRAQNDFLYRKSLDGLVAFMATSSDADEIRVRFWQEAQDARGMCCEGHLSRLANTLVGFHTDVAPPVPVGEILQQKMSAIASGEESVEEKVERARAVFAELGVPPADQTPWLEAL